MARRAAANPTPEPVAAAGLTAFRRELRSSVADSNPSHVHRRASRSCPPRRREAEPGRGPGGADGAAGAVPRLRFRLFHSPSREIRMNFIAPRAEPLIREIPLSRLALAPENVRKTPPDPQADASLKASIAALGLLENLVVRPDEPDSGRHRALRRGRRRAPPQGHAGAGRGQGVRCRPSGALPGPVRRRRSRRALARRERHPHRDAPRRPGGRVLEAGRRRPVGVRHRGAFRRVRAHRRAAAAPRQRRARSCWTPTGRTRSTSKC